MHTKSSPVRPRVMGIVNATPDSFSDGGRFLDPAAALAHARRLIAEGADILDLGAESTRPGVGFGKHMTRHNQPLLAGLDRITALGFPVLLGGSRKGFIGAVSRKAA